MTRWIRHLALLGLAAAALMWSAFRVEAEKVVPLAPIFRVSAGRSGPLKGMSYAYFEPRRREVYVCARSSGRVAVFDEHGQPMFDIHIRIRDPRTGNLVDGAPRGVAVDSRGRIYVLDDLRPEVQVRSYRGDLEQLVDLAELTGLRDERIMPVALAIDAQDNIYIANASTPEIMVFGPDWTLAERFGSRGDEPGLFQQIAGLSVPRPGHVYVVQRQGVPVQVFTPEDRPTLSFGAHDYGKGNFSMPASILAVPTGEMLVVDRMRHFVKVFDSQGTFAYEFGGQGSGLGRFHFPVSITGDGESVVYVLDSVGLTGFEVTAPIGKLITREVPLAGGR